MTTANVAVDLLSAVLIISSLGITILAAAALVTELKAWRECAKDSKCKERALDNITRLRRRC